MLAATPSPESRSPARISSRSRIPEFRSDPGSKTTNSSPPSRPTTSRGPATLLSVRAIATNAASPAACPRVSLIVLNSSCQDDPYQSLPPAPPEERTNQGDERAMCQRRHRSLMIQLIRKTDANTHGRDDAQHRAARQTRQGPNECEADGQRPRCHQESRCRQADRRRC